MTPHLSFVWKYAFTVLQRRHVVIFFKYLVKMCPVGEAQFFRYLGHIFRRVFQHVPGSCHGKRHAIVEQAFAGKFFHDSAKVGTIVMENAR